MCVLHLLDVTCLLCCASNGLSSAQHFVVPVLCTSSSVSHTPLGIHANIGTLLGGARAMQPVSGAHLTPELPSVPHAACLLVALLHLTPLLNGKDLSWTSGGWALIAAPMRP